MSYFKILGFEKEPFSTSPDPDFFYLSREHDQALTNVLIQLRLKRGLSVILGDIGTGKTSLSRKLVQELYKRNDFLFHIILNPSFENEKEFLASIVRNFNIPLPHEGQDISASELRDIFEKFLFEKNMNEGKTVSLIIDEAQKLSEATLEALRVLLNYETNEFKLIQILLLGQLELYSKILIMPNFYDRIDFKYVFNPLSLQDTKEMIEFRLQKAGQQQKAPLFMDEAVQEIYQYTKGYPRRITMLCHKALKMVVMEKKLVVDRQIVKAIIDEEIASQWQRTQKSFA